jgi:gas vesicle protein
VIVGLLIGIVVGAVIAAVAVVSWALARAAALDDKHRAALTAMPGSGGLWAPDEHWDDAA